MRKKREKKKKKEKTMNQIKSKTNLIEKCLVVHSHPTSIPPLCTWTNNVRDSRESIVGPYFFNNIIGPCRQW